MKKTTKKNEIKKFSVYVPVTIAGYAQLDVFAANEKHAEVIGKKLFNNAIEYAAKNDESKLNGLAEKVLGGMFGVVVDGRNATSIEIDEVAE